MTCKFLFTRFTSAGYREDIPEGPRYYAYGQVISTGPADFNVGNMWRTKEMIDKSRIIIVEGMAPSEGEMYAGSEYADAQDLQNWGMVLGEDETPPMLRKRMWLFDLDAIESWWLGTGKRSGDGNPMLIPLERLDDFRNTASQLPKTRWTKEEMEGARKRAQNHR